MWSLAEVDREWPSRLDRDQEVSEWWPRNADGVRIAAEKALGRTVGVCGVCPGKLVATEILPGVARWCPTSARSGISSSTWCARFSVLGSGSDRWVWAGRAIGLGFGLRWTGLPSWAVFLGWAPNLDPISFLFNLI